jgi:hypothetical protein
MMRNKTWSEDMTGRRAAAGVSGLFVSLAFGALTIGLPRHTLAQGLPDRLADSTFWRLVTTFSEPSGYFASDNYVSNENEWQYVIPPKLSAVDRNGAYLGVGPEQNFTYIAAFQPRIAFITDIRRQNMLQHLLYKALIEMSADRAELLSMLFARIRPNGVDSASTPAQLVAAFSPVAPDSALYFNTLRRVYDQLVQHHGFTLTRSDSTSIRDVLSVFVDAGLDVNYASGTSHTVGTTVRGGGVSFDRETRPMRPGYSTFSSLMLEDDGAGVNRGWLGSEIAFRVVKEYQTRNLIIPIVGDFAGGKALRSVGEYLAGYKIRVSAFYVSNVEQYLFEDATNWSKFYANVAALPLNSNAMFIRSLSNRAQVTPRKSDSRLAQLTSPIATVVGAYLGGSLRTYFDLIELRDR